MLNVVLFGMTAKQWRDDNSGKKGNLGDIKEIMQRIIIECAD